MDTLYSLIGVGIATGILTSALIFLLVAIFQKIVVPWYEQRVYQGIRIDGHWHWIDVDDDAAVIELKQYGGKVSGIYTYMDSARRGDTKLFNVEGWVKDRFVQLNMTSVDPGRLGILSYVLEVVGDGDALKGCSVYYSSNEHSVCANPESFFRTRDLAIANLNVNQETCEPTVGEEAPK